MHRYRSHTCGELRAPDVGARRPAERMAAQPAESGRHPLHRSARPPRHRPAGRAARAGRGARAPQLALEGVRRPRRRQGQRARCRQRQPRAAHGRDRGRGRRRGGARRRRADSLHDQRRGRGQRGEAPRVPLPRPAPRAHAPEHHPALAGHREDPREDGRPGLQRAGDADPFGHLARGRPRLPRTLAAAPREVLRVAAGTAAVQAAADDRGLRPVLPDRPLLPGRGRPRGPLARRVLPARHGDELRRAGGRLRGHREGDDRAVPGVRRRP